RCPDALHPARAEVPRPRRPEAADRRRRRRGAGAAGRAGRRGRLVIQRRRLAVGLMLAALVIGLDQATKAWMMGLLLDPPRAVVLAGFFELVPVWNRGVSFGILSSRDGSTAWLLGGVAVVVAAGLAVWLARAERGLLAFGLGLVIGGALGNVIDRGRFGAVFD